MLASITPLGERGRRRNWTTTAISYGLGSIAGGASTGLAFGAIGVVAAPFLDPVSGWILALALVIGATFEMNWIPLRLPTITRQVDADWLDEYRGWVVGAGFGLQLGAAFFTIVTSASVYLTFLTASLTGSVAAGAIIGAVFGAARAAPLLAIRKVTTPHALASVHRRMDSLAAAAHVVVAAGATVLAVVTIGGVLS